MHTLEDLTDGSRQAGRQHPWASTEADSFRTSFDRTLFSEVLDSIDDAYVAFEASGLAVCRNLAFERLVDDRHTLEHEGRRLALSYSRSLDALPPRVSEFTTAAASYRMRVTHAGSVTDRSRLILVSYERTAARLHPLALRYRLTPRELHVAQLVAEGHTNKTVAATLGVSTHTVRHHVGRLLGKIGARRRGELAARFWNARDS